MTALAVFRPVTSLPPRAEALLWELHRWRQQRSYPASVRRLTRQLGWTTTSNVQWWLFALAERGLIRRLPLDGPAHGGDVQYTSRLAPHVAFVTCEGKRMIYARREEP